jgi:hypothetical protein
MIKELFKKVKRKILSVWTKLSEESRENIVKKFSSSLNYLFNSLLLSIPLCFIIYHSISLKYYGIIVLCVWVLLPFIEDYYVWFREKWKDDLPK